MSINVFENGKLHRIAGNAQDAKIDSIKVNDEVQPIVDKSVDLSVVPLIDLSFTNFDEITTPGFYQIVGGPGEVNPPEYGQICGLIVTKEIHPLTPQDYYLQQLAILNDNKVFVRSKVGSNAWSAWKRLSIVGDSFGICSTTASTATKTVSITGWTLDVGASVIVKFTNGNTASNAKLNINSLGAKPIYFNNSAVGTDVIKANGVYTFVYDGTNFVLTNGVGDYLPLSGGTMTNHIVFKMNNAIADFIFASFGEYSVVLSPAECTFEKVIIKKGGLVPYSNDMVDLGSSYDKWKNIYATNGVIQTSDVNAKKEIETLSIDKAKDLILNIEPVTYKMIDGTSDRTHWGMLSNGNYEFGGIEKVLDKLGWDSKDFAGFIKSPHYDVEYIDEEYEEKVTLEDGTVETVTNTRKKRIETLDTNRFDYSLRYDEFISPHIRVTQSHEEEIKSLKQTVQKQDDRIGQLENEVAELKSMVHQLLNR